MSLESITIISHQIVIVILSSIKRDQRWAIMQNWSPEFLFYFTYAMSALTSVGVEFVHGRKPKFFYLLGVILVYGSMGGGLGMLVYEFAGGRKSPWLVVICGILVGARVLKTKDVGDFARRLLAIPIDRAEITINKKRHDSDSHLTEATKEKENADT